jgi:protein gp37
MGSSRYIGITKKVGAEIRWTGKVDFVESALELPLRWKKPRRIFVNSMSDLFHEKVKDEWIAAIFGVMLLAGQHTYQILTKRPLRMRNWMQWLMHQPDQAGVLLDALGDHLTIDPKVGRAATGPWPKPHIWLGVSVEDQETANERIPLLLQTPAAVRWVSYEPALGPVDFYRWTLGDSLRRLSWVVIGGESGPGARPFDLHWGRQVIAQCQAAGVATFMKQVGSKPTTDHRTRPAGEEFFLLTADRKGGDMTEWPRDLRVREYPQ